jgi:hypothetical protein
MATKTIDKGVIKINELSYFDFSRQLQGVDVIDRRTGINVPRFVLFWKGLTIYDIKRIYSLTNRVR